MLLLQLLVGLVCASVLGVFRGFELGASVLTGALMMAFVLGMLGWAIHRLLEKKSIAWTVSIIVIKYAVLLSSLYILGRTTWFSTEGAGLGLATFVLAILVYAAFEQWEDSVDSLKESGT